MFNTLVVTWERSRVAAAQIGSGDAARVAAAWSAEWPEGVSPLQNPAEASRWLKQQWAAAGLTADSVWVVVPREDVVLRHLELPVAPDDELPDMVRFQASGRSTVPLEQLSLDFLPLAPFPGRDGRDVLAATVPRAMVEAIRRLIDGTDRTLAGVTLTSQALAEWGAQTDRKQQRRSQEHDSSATLVVGWDGARIELTVVCGHELTFAHAARLPLVDGVDPTPAVLAEISRTLVAGQRLRPGLKVSHGWLLGGNDLLAGALSRRLDCIVEPVEPIATHSQAGPLQSLSISPVVAATLLGVRSPPVLPTINFLKPRQAPPKRDPRKRVIAVAAAATLLVSFLVGGSGLLRLQSLDRQIQARYDRSQELQESVDLGKPVMAGTEVVSEWEQRNLNQLALLTDLEAVMPGGYGRPYLAEYDYAVGSGDAIGKVSGTGAAKTRVDIETLLQDLRQERGLQVLPKEVTSSRDPDYPFRYTLDLNIPRQRATATKAAPGATSPAAGTPATDAPAAATSAPAATTSTNPAGAAEPQS